MRLLLVEDDAQLSKRLKASLKQAGFAVDVAENGLDAEHAGMEIDYDIVVLDLGLPQKSGIEVLQQWRNKNRKMPVIILTARDAWYERVDGFKAGADDYLGKPFHVEELLARIRALIRRQHEDAPNKFHLRGYVLDEEKQQLLNDETVIELTGIEFRLLRYFLLHPGKILSKTRLTEHVYENDADKDSNVIEVYVNHLRKKIGKDIIETRRGQGYIFRSDD
ncbi:MAG TPA: response regulator transcription factor [Chromatiales bacterium]|nr:response regulator transcription factor [Thiotrichales bacterium]HIP69084.1 response regulator transcription factor [Chromatiales bacterium]